MSIKCPICELFSPYFMAFLLLVCYVPNVAKRSIWDQCKKYIQCESKNPGWNFLTFSPNGWEYLVQVLHAYYTFLSTLDYRVLFNYLQLWRSYAILNATAIMCSKCPPSTETHAGWSHLIWHYFVKVGDNWIKICTLAHIWTFNRRVKFGLKIPNCLGTKSSAIAGRPCDAKACQG